MALVSCIDVDVATPGSKAAEEEVCGSIQTPHITRQSSDALHILRPPQRLIGRGSAFNNSIDSAGGDARHGEWSCHARHRVK